MVETKKERTGKRENWKTGQQKKKNFNRRRKIEKCKLEIKIEKWKKRDSERKMENSQVYRGFCFCKKTRKIISTLTCITGTKRGVGRRGRFAQPEKFFEVLPM